VRVKLPGSIGICHIGGEIDRRRHRLQLNIDTRFLAGLLYDRLGLLARGVDRSLEYELQLFAVLGADAVGAALPASLFQQLIGFVDIELPFCLLRDEALRIVEEVCGCDPGAPVYVLLDRGTIDEQAERLPDCRIAEQWMLRLWAGALAVYFCPRIGEVD